MWERRKTYQITGFADECDFSQFWQEEYQRRMLENLPKNAVIQAARSVEKTSFRTYFENRVQQEIAKNEEILLLC